MKNPNPNFHGTQSNNIELHHVKLKNEEHGAQIGEISRTPILGQISLVLKTEYIIWMTG